MARLGNLATWGKKRRRRSPHRTLASEDSVRARCHPRHTKENRANVAKRA